MLAAGSLEGAGPGMIYRYYHFYNTTSKIWQERKLIHEDYMPHYESTYGVASSCVQDNEGRVSNIKILYFVHYKVTKCTKYCIS